MAQVVAVTGGAGYIGCHLVRRLLAQGYDVRVIDCGLFGFEGFPSDPHLTLFDKSILDFPALTTAFSGVDAVVHLAGLVGDPACAVNPDTTLFCNVVGTRSVHAASVQTKVPRLIFASSCSVYGSSNAVCDEQSSLNPVSLYAETKAQSEQELIRDTALPVTILRFSTVYGYSPRPRFDLVANLFTAQAVKEGALTVKGENAWRPFVHARDVADAIVTVLNADERVNRQIYNVGGEAQNYTIGQLARLVQSVTAPNYQDPVTITTVETVDDQRNYRVSFEKIHSELDWTPSTSMAKGISELANYVFEGIDYRRPEYYNHLADLSKIHILMPEFA